MVVLCVSNLAVQPAWQGHATPGFLPPVVPWMLQLGVCAQKFKHPTYMKTLVLVPPKSSEDP